MKKIAHTQKAWNSDRHILECCICHENDRNLLFVEGIGLSAGMSGDDYTFCKKCWKSKDLGDKVLKKLGFDPEFGMKYKDSSLDIEEI